MVFPLSEIRSQSLNSKAIPDDHPYCDTLNLPAFNQNRGKLSEASVSPTTRPTRKQNLDDTLAMTHAHTARHRPPRDTLTPATTFPSSPPSSSSSELLKVDEAILADTPEALKKGASIIIMSSPNSTSEGCHPRRRRSTGPTLGVFIEPADAKPPRFDYFAAVHRLREHQKRQDQHDAAIRRRFKEFPTSYTSVFEALEGTPQAFDAATDQIVIAHEDEYLTLTYSPQFWHTPSNYTSTFEALEVLPRIRDEAAGQSMVHEDEVLSHAKYQQAAQTLESQNEGIPRLYDEVTAKEIETKEDNFAPPRDEATAQAIEPVDDDVPPPHDEAKAQVTGIEDNNLLRLHDEAGAQIIDREGDDQAESDGDPAGIDGPYEGNAMLRILQMAARPDPPRPSDQPAWQQVRPSSSCKHSSRRKRFPDDSEDASIQEVLQMQAKKSRKERGQTPTTLPALGTIGSRKDGGWKKGLMDSVVKAEARKERY